MIRREFGVALSVVSVGRLVRKLGMPPQRPLHRAYQQNPEAVERWKNQEYPAIRDAAEAEGAVVWFADEAGIRPDYHAGATWSPVGQTPQMKNTGARYSVNMISAHRATATNEFAASTQGRLKLFFLPGYSLPQRRDPPSPWQALNLASDTVRLA